MDAGAADELREEQDDTVAPSFEARFQAWLGRDERFELTRFVLLRLLGVVYSAVFLSIV